MSQEDVSIEAVQRDLLMKIQTEGVKAAYEASLAVCRDPKAPAPARATASATLFRVAGYFDRQERNLNKEPHEMTGDELAQAITQLEAQVKRAKSDDLNVFG